MLPIFGLTLFVLFYGGGCWLHLSNLRVLGCLVCIVKVSIGCI